MAVGIPGFLAHAHASTSLGLDAMLHKTFTDPNAGYSEGMVQGFAGLSIFTFMLLTPAGWLECFFFLPISPPSTSPLDAASPLLVAPPPAPSLPIS